MKARSTRKKMTEAQKEEAKALRSYRKKAEAAGIAVEEADAETRDAIRWSAAVRQEIADNKKRRPKR